MFSPFYILFAPIFLIFGGGMLALYLRITHDPDCQLQRKIKSDLQEAQELDQQEQKSLAESTV
jgi:hypothetical protein